MRCEFTASHLAQFEDRELNLVVRDVVARRCVVKRSSVNGVRFEDVLIEDLTTTDTDALPVKHGTIPSFACKNTPPGHLGRRSPRQTRAPTPLWIGWTGEMLGSACEPHADKRPVRFATIDRPPPQHRSFVEGVVQRLLPASRLIRRSPTQLRKDPRWLHILKSEILISNGSVIARS